MDPNCSATFGKVLLWLCSILIPLVGCTRSHYRQRADDQTYEIVHEKTFFRPWQVPTDFSIEPDTRSRLFDPFEDPDHPVLPSPEPRLYGYELPQPVTRIETVSNRDDIQTMDVPTDEGGWKKSASSAEKISNETLAQNPPVPKTSSGVAGLPLVPIPVPYWEEIPPECLVRMFEFHSVREEYHSQYGSDPREKFDDDSPRLMLEEIVRLARLNSREYQRQKELLYRAALALTLRRYDYSTKFLVSGNGTDVNFDHDSSGGRTVDTLKVPTKLGGDKMLATAGSFLARFANDVVLTFGGPNGFTKDLTSELFFDFSQTVFQRNILLEPLIQAERDVVYAARDFARFRKTFFFDFASEYYSLIRTYRQIEIEAQNYFSLVRALNQAEAEERSGIQEAPSRIGIEQIEQNVLDGRSRLISQCNDLESGLDSLKISIGLPTETPINLDLTELERLTIADEIAVASERVQRAYRRLESLRSKPIPDRSDVLNSAIELIERSLEWFGSTERLQQEIPDLGPTRQLYAEFRVDEARLGADLARQELELARGAVPPSPPIQLFLRIMDLIDVLKDVNHRQSELAGRLGKDSASISAMQEESRKIRVRSDQLRDQVEIALNSLEEERLQKLEKLLEDAEKLLEELQHLIESADRLIGTVEQPEPKVQTEKTLRQVDGLLTRTEQWLFESEVGLVPVELGVDDAMMTALLGRLDLMNQRGTVADDWRDLELMADDLKSILNLNASQTIKTKMERPFGFTLDESQTELKLSFDLPFNRRAQRNDYRSSSIDYQNELRSLTQLEDEIKLAVRDLLRDLVLSRQQYEIRVASAALAAERVFSTRLTLALGFPGVATRDFLEAQDAYRDSLSGVADNHIGYIVDRARFFLDLELMQLDESGFWPQIDDEDYQPMPINYFSSDAGPPYGEIPRFLKVSQRIRRMFELR